MGRFDSILRLKFYQSHRTRIHCDRRHLPVRHRGCGHLGRRVEEKEPGVAIGVSLVQILVFHINLLYVSFVVAPGESVEEKHANAISSALGISFAGSIIRDQSAEVQRIYLLIEMILFNFEYLAEISLLLTIWCLLSYCATKPQHTGAKPYRMLGWFHLLFACVLLGLWVGIMYSSIDYRVRQIRYDNSIFGGFSNRSRRTWRDLDMAYTALYLVASIEAVALTVMNHVKSRGQHNDGTVSSSTIHPNTRHLPDSHRSTF